MDTLCRFENSKRKKVNNLKLNRPQHKAAAAPSYKVIDSSQMRTPQRAKFANSSFTEETRSPNLSFSSPVAANSAAASPSPASQHTPGQVMCQHGECAAVNWAPASGQEKLAVEIEVDENSLAKPFKYMYEKLLEKAADLNAHVSNYEDAMKNDNGIGELGMVHEMNQETVTVVGRICRDEGQDKQRALYLEGCAREGWGKKVGLDLSLLQNQGYSFFPGQLVAVEGTNPSGREFVVQRVVDRLASPPLAPPSDSPPLHVLAASGPYTALGSLQYDGLKDFLDYIRAHRPHLVIMTGPFVDANHPMIKSGQMDCTYEQLFCDLIGLITLKMEDVDTEFVLVPSPQDVTAESVYPTPPFEWTEMPKPRNMHFVSDPCTFKACGYSFGVTGTDIMMHLGAKETYVAGSGHQADRFSRLSGHLIRQHSFYPLYPPREDVNVDYEFQSQHGNMSENGTPLLLLLPSQFSHFVKDVDGVCCVNPARLTKGNGSGTFARIFITRSEDNSTKQPTVAAQVVHL